jgi:DNA-binding transcriptional regulator YdaS (Cro superfamily)
MAMATDGMDLIRSRRGLLAEVARGLGLTRGAVTRWHRVPAERLAEIEALTGIPRERLRPDICRAPCRAAALAD